MHRNSDADHRLDTESPTMPWMIIVFVHRYDIGAVTGIPRGCITVFVREERLRPLLSRVCSASAAVTNHRKNDRKVTRPTHDYHAKRVDLDKVIRILRFSARTPFHLRANILSHSREPGSAQRGDKPSVKYNICSEIASPSILQMLSSVRDFRNGTAGYG